MKKLTKKSQAALTLFRDQAVLNQTAAAEGWPLPYSDGIFRRRGAWWGRMLLQYPGRITARDLVHENTINALARRDLIKITHWSDSGSPWRLALK
jgi:hypothetical protein